MKHEKTLVMIGASGHGRVAADIARRMGYDTIVFLDDARTAPLGRYEVVGKSSDCHRFAQNAEFFVAIGNNEIRSRIQTKLKEDGLRIATLIHPAAMIGEDVTIGEGTIVMAGAVINPNTTIGNGCIINTCSSLDHDNVIGDFCHISVGSHLAGTVHVSPLTMIGAGATVINNIDICERCMIGAGAVVVRNICESGTYKGVPAVKG